MGIEINVGGVWKDVTEVWINVGGVWKQCTDIPINVGGVWKTDILASGPTVSAQANGDSNYVYGGACYVGVQFNMNGLEYERNASSGSYNVGAGTWLDSGSAGDVWVAFTRTAGTMFASKVSGTRYNLVSGQSFSNTALLGAYKTVTGYFKFYDAASGGNTLQTTSTVSWIADSESGGGCPLCCFTPDTLVSMERGIDVPIASVRDGDRLHTPFGVQAVGKVIVRYDVPVFPLRFSDGRTINITPDHPVQTERGPASLSQHDYKDLGVPEKLQVGDRVFTDKGTWVRLEHIGQEWKEPVVYTFDNSPFYANGLFVY